MTLLKKTDFELQAPGTTGAAANNITGFDGTPTNGASAVLTAPSGLGISCRDSRYMVLERTSAAVLEFSQSVASASSLRIRFYLTWLTAPSAQGAYVVFQNNGTNRAQIFAQNGPPFTSQLRNVAALVGSASATMVLNRRQRYEWKIDGPNGVQSLIIYDPDEVTKFYDTGDVTFTSNAGNALRFGNQAVANFKFAFDSLRTSNRMTEEIGPESNMGFGFNMAAAA